MFHVYTFGKGSIQFLILTPKQAQTMNDFTDCFFRSQENYLNEHGFRWDPLVDPRLTMLVPDEDPKLIERYNKVADVCNLQHKIRNRIYDLFRLDLSDEDMDDYLVKRF